MFIGLLPVFLFIVTCVSTGMDVYVILKELDEQLADVLLNPEKSDGDCVIKDLNHYISVTDLMSKKLQARTFKTLDGARAVYIYGKPKFLDRHFKLYKIEKTYKWAKKEVKLFLYLIRTCYYHWINFKKNYVECKLSPEISTTTLGPNDIL